MAALTDVEIQKELQTLSGWEVRAATLTRTYQLPSFTHAVLFFGAVAQLAEAAGHHPDLHLHGWNKLTIELTTHSAGGLTDKDFNLARQISQLPQRQSK